jgi:hypothetical protein
MTIQNRQYVNNIQGLHEETMVLNEDYQYLFWLWLWKKLRTKESGDVDWIPDFIWDGPETWWLQPGSGPPVNPSIPASPGGSPSIPLHP